MKQRQWQVKRTEKASADGQKRWDRAYLLVLAIAQAVQQSQETPNAEVNHASSDLCPGINPTAGASPDH